MTILIGIILYLIAIVLSMTLGNIFKNTDDPSLKEIVKSGTKNRNRSYHPVHNMFRDLRHQRSPNPLHKVIMKIYFKKGIQS